jgi:hypothetical protein
LKRSTFIVLVALMMGLVACGPVPPREAFGLSVSSQGAAELRFGRCVGTPELYVRRASDEPTPPVWHIYANDWRSRQAGVPLVVIVGEVPPGWRATPKLKHPLEPGVRYTAEAWSGEAYVYDFDFTLADLKPGYVLDFTHDLVPEAEFPTKSGCSWKSPTRSS